MQTRIKANLAVAISICGSFLTMPYAESNAAMAVLHHGFLAATIGGMADWFAVRAIFGKPLGISYRTDILRNNRQRIMQGLVDFSASDLLRTENIMKNMAKEDFSLLLIAYLRERGGMEKVQKLATTIFGVFLQGIDVKQLSLSLSPCFRRILAEIKIDSCLSAGLNVLNTDEVRKTIITYFFGLLEKISANTQTQVLLEKYVTAILQEYEGGGFGRGFMMSSMGLTSDKVLLKLNEQSRKWLADNQEKDSAVYQRIDNGIEKFMLNLGGNEDFILQLQAWKENKLADLDFGAYLQESIERYISANEAKWCESVCAAMDDRLTVFENSSEQQKNFQSLVFHWLEKKLQEHQAMIPLIMHEQLDRLSDDELVKLAEAKVEDDLQMIRINGAIVGALTGMVLYIVSCGVLRGLGA